jgi:hypothetical protein
VTPVSRSWPPPSFAQADDAIGFFYGQIKVLVMP